MLDCFLFVFSRLIYFFFFFPLHEDAVTVGFDAYRIFFRTRFRYVGWILDTIGNYGINGDTKRAKNT